MATIEERITALESEQRAMREEWAVVVQAPLLNARMLSALRETQMEHGQRLERIEREHGQRLDRIESDVAEVRHGVEMLVTMLTTLIERDGE